MVHSQKELAKEPNNHSSKTILFLSLATNLYPRKKCRGQMICPQPKLSVTQILQALRVWTGLDQHAQSENIIPGI